MQNLNLEAIKRLLKVVWDTFQSKVYKSTWYNLHNLKHSKFLLAYIQFLLEVTDKYWLMKEISLILNEKFWSISSADRFWWPLYYIPIISFLIVVNALSNRGKENIHKIMLKFIVIILIRRMSQYWSSHTTLNHLLQQSLTLNIR